MVSMTKSQSVGADLVVYIAFYAYLLAKCSTVAWGLRKKLYAYSSRSMQYSLNPVADSTTYSS